MPPRWRIADCRTRDRLTANRPPLLILLARGRRPSEATAIAMMTVGAGVALGWRAAGLSDALYEGLPGILAGLATFQLAHRLQRPALGQEASDR